MTAPAARSARRARSRCVALPDAGLPRTSRGDRRGVCRRRMAAHRRRRGGARRRQLAPGRPAQPDVQVGRLQRLSAGSRSLSRATRRWRWPRWWRCRSALPGGGPRLRGAKDDARPRPSEEELRSFLRERLANYKVPKRLFVRDALPMLPVGKVDRVALLAEAAGCWRKPRRRMSETQSPERSIGLSSAVFILVGYTIGASIFILPGQLAADAGPGAFVSYLIAGGASPPWPRWWRRHRQRGSGQRLAATWPRAGRWRR